MRRRSFLSRTAGFFSSSFWLWPRFTHAYTFTGLTKTSYNRFFDKYSRDEISSLSDFNPYSCFLFVIISVDIYFNSLKLSVFSQRMSKKNHCVRIGILRAPNLKRTCLRELVHISRKEKQSPIYSKSKFLSIKQTP